MFTALVCYTIRPRIYVYSSSMFHYKAANLCLQLSCAVSLRSEDCQRGRGLGNDANSHKVCLHSQQMAKISKTIRLTVLPTGAKARIFRLASKNREKRLLALSRVSPSIRPLAWNSAPAERFSLNFIFQHFFENLSRKFQFHPIRQE